MIKRGDVIMSPRTAARDIMAEALTNALFAVDERVDYDAELTDRQRDQLYDQLEKIRNRIVMPWGYDPITDGVKARAK